MNCKYCNAELPEEATLCPACGKEQAEEVAEEVAAETVQTGEIASGEEVPFKTDFEAPVEEEIEDLPKSKSRRVVITVVACILLAATVLGIAAGIFGRVGGAEPTIAPTSGVLEETTPVVIPSSGDPASALCKASYTASNEALIAAADVVVATMGDRQLTNAELQAYYWQEIYMFLEENYSYALYMGLDLTQPLDQQLLSTGEAGISWQQFFLDGAVSTWKNYQALALEAEANGYQLPAERQAELDSMAADLEAGAISSGFANADEMIAANVGANCTLEDYMHYVETYYHGMSYYEDYCNALNPSDAEIEAYYEANKEAFEGSGVTKDAKYMDVRHILALVEGGTTAEDGSITYSDEEWEACRLEAQAILDEWLAGEATEESFAALANEKSDDGDGTIGGLYEFLNEDTNFVTNFKNWYLDESRQVGDYGLVQSEYGYHVMYFSAHRDWRDYAKLDLINGLAYEFVPATVEKHPATVDFSLVELANISFE